MSCSSARPASWTSTSARIASWRPPPKAWLGDARRITYDIPPIGAVLVQAEEGRRLDVRALGTADVGPGCVRGWKRSNTRRSRSAGCSVVCWMRRAMPGGSTTRALRTCFWDSPRRSASLRRPSRRSGSWSKARLGRRRTVGVAHVEALREALDGLQEARARLDDLLMADSDSQLLELHAAVLSTVKRLMREMDLDERIRRQLRLLPLGPDLLS